MIDDGFNTHFFMFGKEERGEDDERETKEKMAKKVRKRKKDEFFPLTLSESGHRMRSN